MYLFLFTDDCEAFRLKTLVEPCTVYYQETCFVKCCIYEIFRRAAYRHVKYQYEK